MTQTLLITGGAGFIGSHFVKLAVKRGYFPVILDALTYSGNLLNLEPLAADAYDFIEGSIGDSKLVDTLLSRYEPTAVIHFAAESHVDNSIDASAAFIHTNVNGTHTLLECARTYWQNKGEPNTFRFVHISTDEVFGELALDSKERFNETSPYRPNSPYSASKAASDHLVRAWFETYQLPTIITNCSNNYGSHQYPEKLIPHMIHCALNARPLPVYGHGKNIRDWIHVEDHCTGILQALEKGRIGETYCLGGDSERTNLQVVEQICTALDRLAPKKRGNYSHMINFVKDRPGHDLRYAINSQKAKNELSFYQAHRFESSLEATVRWYIENQDWCEAVL